MANATPSLVAQAIEKLTETNLRQARVQLLRRRENALLTWGLFFLFAAAAGAAFGAAIAEGPMARAAFVGAIASVAAIAFFWGRARRERTAICRRLNEAIDGIGAARAMALSSDIGDPVREWASGSFRATLDARDRNVFATPPPESARIDGGQNPP